MPVPRAVLLAVVLVGLTAYPAAGQIYSWQDANGTLVLSDRALSKTAQVVAAASRDEGSSGKSTALAAPKAAGYEGLIAETARRHDVRPDLVRAVIQVESAFNPSAVSPKGAMGLMQLMPATARSLGVGNPFDPRQNVGAGVAYLRHLLDRYDDDERLALAAYNAGPGAVDRYGRAVPPYRETLDYVARISKAAGQSRQAEGPLTTIYRTVEIVEGRTIARYSDRPR